MSTGVSGSDHVNGRPRWSWRRSVLVLLTINTSVPLLLGGLIAVAESGDPRILSCGAGVLAVVIGIALARRPRTVPALPAGSQDRKPSAQEA